MAQPVEHFEIIGTDPAALRGYYGELFGWQFTTGGPVADPVSEAGNYGFTEGETIPGGVRGCADRRRTVPYEVTKPYEVTTRTSQPSRITPRIAASTHVGTRWPPSRLRRTSARMRSRLRSARERGCWSGPSMTRPA
ncbi:VOC family protein [Paractinoplanes hotanensis]|uniref:VOC domain-containing protein n=1 Tax=Paractinoplanes hotanensis TaxID=2906497 RepID=A0ABT0XUY2_9ACTN|nr:hypothetical protein [Actinoplanes hotanensis]MCM4077596.1 hypothetical protein [Actinoplanes hotanensis]